MEERTLPQPRGKGTVSLEEAIAKRRSERSFLKESIGEEEISQLLWAAQGITDSRGLRASPSAGATYPLEIYYLTKEGLYRYIPQGHKSKKLSSKDLRASLSQAAYSQAWVKDAPLSIVICAVYSRTSQRYGEKANMYVHMEVGHAAQNIHLQAIALGLGSVPVGAFTPKEVTKALALPKEEIPLYIIPVGHVRKD